MNFLLDTNVCIAVINATSDSARQRFDRALKSRHQLFVSSVAVFELWFGVFRSSRVKFNADRLDAFLDAPITILPFDEADARTAGLVNAELHKTGTRIGAYDLLLAGQALEKNLSLVTANIREFSRVKGLMCQDWSGA